jgi:DNA-binding NtrC family response regulator
MTGDKKDITQLPLHNDQKDVLLLAKQYIESAEQQVGTEPKILSKSAEEYLLSCDWGNNEHELETTVKRACILSEGECLEVEDFDLKHRKATSIGKFVESRLKGFMRNIKRFEKFNLYEMVMPEVEKALIIMVLKETKGNQVKASRLLGINRNTLRTKIKKLGIKVKSSK